ncbi:unnamed protein product, partial [marine sediment metagenome]
MKEPEEQIDVKLNYSQNRVVKEACNYCGVNTNHSVLCSA